MKFQNLIRRLFKKEPSFRLRRRDALFNPGRDWTAGAGLFFIFTLILLLWAGYLFYEVEQGELFVVKKTTEGAVTQLDQKMLDTVTALYREKAAQFQELKTGRPASYTDPSK
ncbi:hypothetical protein A3D66_00340 [Candidatus Kaiserbacteria bacterium RIFCSPHIGHO2_02_FULL_50_9]|uniref:Uncharacterized protein n=1 Tax=Candidatus Kaiserbacteria bacterium RIFCSPLOWO2_01_FULL_51_21 TaxID=1798508 RepID=A0A1F6ED83_9BACT|nr:MAG: hypothetical protein A2761_02360 [Candidatus Kaiserbacteria bacterium RIFCSPHIGHO2_01_FULL_51_33]OGG63149.1 MAG: hypothetical protein A3D66_00340 [Candidatus Kaiserbacteria bacterium RIFCSPHIGHO2_02_FULL_50_9]OGG71628.1 MAG: hypothetical protein A3A35_00450 [Candidatus Kaiserbacteria bacterium RIFCSPLOWO2_01_FULL_51_21]